MIEICIHINIGLKSKLTQSAKKIGIPVDALAHRLFCRVMKEKRLSTPKVFTRVKYQEADPTREWTTIGIDLRDDMYEKCLDLRKGLKMTVSLILAEAIRLYLSRVIHDYQHELTEGSKTEDNNVQYYSIQCIFHAQIEGFIIKWEKT